MIWLAALSMVLVWWWILRTPRATRPPYVLHAATDRTPDLLQDHNIAATRAWEQRAIDAGEREDQLALLERRNAGTATRAQWLQVHRAMARFRRIAPTSWPRVAAGLTHSLDIAEPLLDRRVTPIRARKRA